MVVNVIQMRCTKKPREKNLKMEEKMMKERKEIHKNESIFSQN